MVQRLRTVKPAVRDAPAGAVLQVVQRLLAGGDDAILRVVQDAGHLYPDTAQQIQAIRAGYTPAIQLIKEVGAAEDCGKTAVQHEFQRSGL